jgi:hypothetical protein
MMSALRSAGFRKPSWAISSDARKILDGKTIIGYFLWLEYKRRREGSAIRSLEDVPLALGVPRADPLIRTTLRAFC